MRLLRAGVFFGAAARVFVLFAAAAFGLRLAVFGREVFEVFFAVAARFDFVPFGFPALFGLVAFLAFTPSRECRMMVFRFGVAAFFAGFRLLFFMEFSFSSAS